MQGDSYHVYAVLEDEFGKRWKERLSGFSLSDYEEYYGGLCGDVVEIRIWKMLKEEEREYFGIKEGEK